MSVAVEETKLEMNVENYLDSLESRAVSGDSTQEELELYRRENEFLKKKLEFYAHLNSHQLRAPLVQIMGLIDMLKKSSISKREELLFEYLDIAAGNMDEMIRCINRVLQVENGSTED
jgi:signal transduction histidine kinase